MGKLYRYTGFCYKAIVPNYVFMLKHIIQHQLAFMCLKTQNLGNKCFLTSVFYFQTEPMVKVFIQKKEMKFFRLHFGFYRNFIHLFSFFLFIPSFYLFFFSCRSLKQFPKPQEALRNLEFFLRSQFLFHSQPHPQACYSLYPREQV